MLDWFTTIPGILITCGVILLFIAIVLFILGNKKGNKASNLAMNTGVMNQPLINDEVVTKDQASLIIDQPKTDSFEGVNPNNPSVIDFTPSSTVETAPIENAPVSEDTTAYDFSIPTMETVNDTSSVSEDTSAYDFSIPTMEPVVETTPVEEKVNPVDFTVPTIDKVEEPQVSNTTNSFDFNIPTMEPVVETAPVEEKVNPVDFTIPTIDKVEAPATDTTNSFDFSIPTIEPVSEPAPAVEPVTPVDFNIPTVDKVEAPATDTTNSFDFSIPTIEPVSEPAPVVEPVVPTVEETRPEVTIYGGNDPLVNTQVNTESTNHEPYMGTPEIANQQVFKEPVVEEEKVNVMPTISIPEIKPIENNQEGLQ